MERSWMRVVLPLIAGACGIDNQFNIPLPVEPHDNPPDLADPTQTDIIVQVTTPKVDVLWTIEQQALTDNFPKFMDYFLGSGLDYHIGVTSTDMDDPSHKGKLQTGGTPYKYIDTDTPNAIGVFTAMASMGVSGSPTERGLGGTYNALETYRDTFNEGFYRDEAAIHTVVLSDEADLTQDSTITENEFINWYGGLKQEADERTFSSIVSMQTGAVYLHVTAEIGGIVWDITDENYAEVLDRLGVQAAGLKREYFLSQIPVLGTIEVTVEDPTGATFSFYEASGDPPVGDWEYDPARNSITFLTFIPTELSRVILHYTIESTVQDDGAGVVETGATSAPP
jgi:hypothetical protein